MNFDQEIVEFLEILCERYAIPMERGLKGENVYFPNLNSVIVFHALPKCDQDQKQAVSEFPVGIRVVHVWEDQWIFQQKKIRSKIRSLLGITKRIHGRETEIARLDNHQLVKFLKENHLNVPIKAKYKYGLLKESELVAVMSFSKSRPMLRHRVTYVSYELLRFCNKLDCTVVGGFSKLLNCFIKELDPDDVMTYVDCDWSDGQLFLRLGFDFVEKIPPMEFWLNKDTGIREYPHVVLKKLQRSVADFSSYEEKAAFLEKHCYVPVYNSGSYKYILNRKLLVCD